MKEKESQQNQLNQNLNDQYNINQQNSEDSNQNIFIDPNKIRDEYEEKIKINDLQQSKLQDEISEFKKRFNAEENVRAKLNEIVKSKNEKIEILSYEIKKYKEIFVDCGKEVKWNQDLVVQKESQIKVLKEKLCKKDIEIQNLRKFNEKVKHKNNSKSIEEEPISEKRKPILFGPEIHDRSY